MRGRLITTVVAGLMQSGFALPERPDHVVYRYAVDERVASLTSYRDGRKVGRHLAYWPGGLPRVSALYRGDILEREYRSWHANGVLAELKHYVDGHEDGVQQAWTDRGDSSL